MGRAPIVILQRSRGWTSGTCIDKIRGNGILLTGAERPDLSASEMIWHIGEATRLPVMLESRGPTRERVMLTECHRMPA